MKSAKTKKNPKTGRQKTTAKTNSIKTATRRQRVAERFGSVAKIQWPHNVLWQVLSNSYYRMWSKYFLQQNRQKEIACLTLLIDRAVEIAPLTIHFDISFINSP